MTDHLNVNLADPQDIADKLPHAQLILESKRKAAAAATKEYDNWKALVTRLEVVAGIEQTASSAENGSSGRKKQAPVQDYAVRIIEREARPMRPNEIADLMRSEGFPVKSTNAVNSALYVAAKAGKLSRPKKGFYAPIDYDGNDGLLASEDGEAQE